MSTREIKSSTLRAAFAPESIDEESRTVELIWTTGERVLRPGFDPYYEELSLDPSHVRMRRLESGAPLLAAHDGSSLDGVIGVVESARLEKGRGVAVVRFSREGDDENADRAFRKVVDGVLRNVSVGYRVHKMERVADGESEIPTLRAIDWEPYELSIVPMGADAGAFVRADGALTYPVEIIGDEEIEQMSKRNLTEKATEVAQPVEPVIDVERERAEAVKAERKRAAGIRRAATAIGLSEDFAERHIDAGTSIDDFRELAIEERASAPVYPEPVHIEPVAGQDERDKWRRGAELGIILRSGFAKIFERAAQKRGEKFDADAGKFRGMSSHDLARDCLERDGVSTRGLSKRELIGMALTHRSGYQTTSDFPILLENTMHKVLLAQYGITPDTWSTFCARGSVSDFRPHNRYRMGTFAALSTVAESGEFQNQALADAEKETITASTKGNMVTISRQALVNDDMSAFLRIAAALGRAARLSIESDVYALLALNAGLGPVMSDGNTMFHANHANVGSGAAISAAALDADAALMAVQTDPSGNEILDLRPSVLVVARGLLGTAKTINAATYSPDAGAALQEPNRAQGLFESVIGTGRMTGTRRYLFADPDIAPAIEVAFLEGMSEPYLEIRDGWRIDGAEYKVRLDYAVGAVDFRPAVTDAGA